MNKGDMFYHFIKRIEYNKLLTLLIKNLFDYNDITDYNYLFRITKDNQTVIIDIYDNISDNRFNRYIFNFGKKINKTKYHKDNVFVTYINVLDIKKCHSKLDKLGYLFCLDRNMMIEYARTFLDEKIVLLLKK